MWCFDYNWAVLLIELILLLIELKSRDNLLEDNTDQISRYYLYKEGHFTWNISTEVQYL